MLYSREVRLGLVLYGGVSLAIYENGVSQELYSAVRGEGVYGLLKDLIDSDIVVDIISGTSAGGVNGVLLGYALANDRDFRSVSRLWREDADIARLLRSKDDPATLSLLDSEGYYQPKLEEALRTMPPWTPQPGSIPSSISELDLFVTGTDVSGNVYTVYDDQGHAIDVKDHRSVFKLAYREGRKNDFDPQAIKEIAMLARITSCFPVAFAPVVVDSRCKYLQRWGKLQRDAVFLDGGILDNKPFSYTIETIFRRTADRDVARFLFYVEPDPERFDQTATGSPPDAVSAALRALINIPGYESIGEDLRSIAQHNERLARFEELAGCLPPPRPSSIDCLEATRTTVVDGSPASRIYLTARLMQLRDRAVKGILNDRSRRAFFRHPSERRAARILVAAFSHWRGNAAETLDNFDIYFRLRRLFHLTYRIKQHLYDDPAGPTEASVQEDYRALWRRINHYINVLEILEWAMERYVDNCPIDWRSLDSMFTDAEGNRREPRREELAAIARDKWGQVADGLTRLLDTAGIALPSEDTAEVRAAFYNAIAARANRLADSIRASEPQYRPQGNLLLALDEELRRVLADFTRTHPKNLVITEFCRFLEIDRLVFPLQFASNIHSRDQINVVRMSPADAQRAKSRRALERKVSGKTLGAFGGFFKKPWRSNDILWGRLDGACQLLECLLTRDRLKRVWGQSGITVDLSRLQAVFPRSAPAVHSSLAEKLCRFHELTDEEFDQFVSEFIDAAQTEIVEEEWPRVIQDALDQEREWSQYRSVAKAPEPGKPYRPEDLTWVPGNTSPDRLVVALAARAVASGHTDLFQHYDVAGKPFLQEIPKPVLLEIGSLASIRIERSLIAGLPDKVGKYVKLPFLHPLLFRWIIPAVHGWARFHRSAPDWRSSLSVAVLTACAVLFSTGILLLSLRVPLPLTAYAALIVAPVLTTGVWLSIFRR
jgi:patatin-related protein